MGPVDYIDLRVTEMLTVAKSRLLEASRLGISRDGKRIECRVIINDSKPTWHGRWKAPRPSTEDDTWISPDRGVTLLFCRKLAAACGKEGIKVRVEAHERWVGVYFYFEI